MRIELGSRILVHDPPAAFAQAWKERAEFQNPAWVKARRFGRRTFGIEPTIRLYEERGGVLELPLGLWGRMSQSLHAGVEVLDRRVAFPQARVPWLGQLYPYQADAARRLFEGGGGVIVGPMASGKTEMGMGVVCKLGEPALWMAPTLDLLDQARERATDLMRVDPDEAFGVIADGQFRLGSLITFATIQSLRNRDLGDLGRHFGVVILDEAHHAPAQTFSMVLQALPGHFRAGLTATPDRADGLGPMMLAVLGPIRATLSTEALIGEGRLMRPSVVQVETPFRLTPEEEVVYEGNYSGLVDRAGEDPVRNAMIVRTTIAEARAGHQCLILTERIWHANYLADLLRDEAPDVAAAAVTSDTPRAERAAAIAAMREGTMRVLVSSQIANEGLNIRTLDRLLIAFGGKEANRTRQRVGRIMRTADGKDPPMVVDFVDPHCSVLARQANARRDLVYRPLRAPLSRVGLPASQALAQDATLTQLLSQAG